MRLLVPAGVLIGLAALASPGSSQQPSVPSAGRAFLVEATGGAIGSGTGLGIGIWLATVDDCASEDLSCTLGQVGVALGLSAVGAAAGAWLAGRIDDTRPSGWGVIVGALAGVPAGLGVVHLIGEDLDRVHNDALQAVAYAVTHGLVTALLSRIAAAVRR